MVARACKTLRDPVFGGAREKSQDGQARASGVIYIYICCRDATPPL